MGSPPLARGILYIYLSIVQMQGITPARAGNTLPLLLLLPLPRDHPRSRGEYEFKQEKILLN